LLNKSIHFYKILLKQRYVTFEILLSGSPYSWETVLSSTTVIKSAMVTLVNTRVHLLTSDTPELCRRKEFSNVGQTVLRVKCLHFRYIGIYFSMSYELSFFILGI